MTKKAKLLERIRNNPKDAKFSERQPKGGCSHYIYYHELLDRIVTLTKGTKQLPEYQAKDALRAMQRLEGNYEEG